MTPVNNVTKPIVYGSTGTLDWTHIALLEGDQGAMVRVENNQSVQLFW